MKEVTITDAQARDILAGEGYDAYGTLRIYGIIGEGVSKGQIAAIKSTYHLDRYQYDRIYTITNDGTIPVIRKG